MAYIPYNNCKGDCMEEFEVIFYEKEKTQKTPVEEIKLAKRRRADFKERMGKL